MPPPSPPPPSFISYGAMKQKILHLIKQGITSSHAIARELSRDRATIKQHLKGMERLGIIKKDGFLWVSTGNQRGGKILTGYEKGSDATGWLHDRAHNLKIKTEILQAPPGNEWLQGWATKELKNNVFYSQRFGDILTTYTGRHLIFQLPILKFKDANIAIAEAGRIGQALIKHYQENVKGLLLGRPSVKAQLITQHHAIPQEPFAKWCIRHGISYHDDDIHIDASNGPELEFTNNQSSNLHHEKYVTQIKEIITEKAPLNSELQESINKIHAILNENASQLSSTIAILNAEAQLNMHNAEALNAVTQILKALIKPQDEPQPQPKDEKLSEYIG